MGKTMRVYKDCEVEIELDDVLDYITDYASEKDIESIKEVIHEDESPAIGTQAEGSYVREEKKILLERASRKYSLQELEERLGNKFDLI